MTGPAAPEAVPTGWGLTVDCHDAPALLEELAGPRGLDHVVLRDPERNESCVV